MRFTNTASGCRMCALRCGPTPLMQTVQARRATMYRRTRKAAAFRARRIEAMRRGRKAERISRPMPERPPDRPDLRIEIIVRRHDCDRKRVREGKRGEVR